MGLKITYAPWGETLAELVDAAQRAEKAGAEVVAMIRFEVGEGIEKEVVSFADEVAAQLKG